MASAHDRLSQFQLYADLEEQLLICCQRECGYALSVARSQVTSHLRDKHNVPADLRVGLTHLLKHEYSGFFRNPAEVALRNDGALIHAKLHLYDGFACRKCKYRTINHSELSRHISKEHLNGRQASRSRTDDLYDDVYLQTWTHGASRKYWIVQKSGSLIRPVTGQETRAHLLSVWEREQKYLETEDQPRVYGRDTGTHTLAATGPWMDRTRWPITYQNVRRDILQALADMPDLRCRMSDHFLGQGPTDSDEALYSQWQDEQKISFLMGAVDRMLDRCEETMRHTSRSLLCWLRSTKPEACYPKPFTPVALDTSKRKYRQLFKRFVAFKFRAFRMPVDLRQQLTGIRFHKKQLRQLAGIWEHRAWSGVDLARGIWSETAQRGVRVEGGGKDEDEDNDEGDDEEECSEDDGRDGENEDDEDEVGNKDDEDEVGNEADWSEHDLGDGISERDEGELIDDRHSGMAKDSDNAVDELLELLFQLSIAFSTEQFTDGQPSSTLLVYFSGVLGFSSDARDFLPARRYTPHLSGLIYIQRLLFLEYALPLHPYTHLGIPQRSRMRQHQRFDAIRRKYMITGAQSPLEELQSLRDFGRVIARSDPPSFLLRWSDDGETVFYGDKFSLTMEKFRALAEHFIVEAERLCDDLMFDLDPKIDLGRVKDDMANSQTGFSFLQHLDNALAKAYLDLSTKACTVRRNGLFRENRWDWKAIAQYEKKTEALEEMLLGGLYTGCGQVPRITEILNLECENSPSTLRGLYAWNGFIVYLTRHHKAKRSTNREFNVVRFLPVRLGHVMYKYLVFIRRFLDMLRRERSGLSNPAATSASQNRLLFRSGHARDKLWVSSRLTAILKDATAKVWGQSVTAQLYRQLTIGITERHVREVHKPFNQFDDRSAHADLNVSLAWQSGHRPLQRGITYGLDAAYPTQLQPALLRAYEWASTQWHEFLRQPSKAMSRTTAAIQEHARSPLPPLPRSPDAHSRPVKRKSLPWITDETHDARPAKRSARPGRQALSSVNNMQRPQSKTCFIDDLDESHEVSNNPLTNEDCLCQDSQEYPLNIIVSRRRPDSYRAMIEGVVAHLERHLQLCALCCSWPQLPHSHILQNCTDADSECIRRRWARMEEGISYEDNETICPHCCLRVLDCTDPSRPHHDGYRLDWDCRYRGVMTALVTKAFFAQHEEKTLEMLAQWMGRDGITLSDKEGWGAWPGEENERVVHKWLGQSVIWFGVKVPRILQVFFQLAEDSKDRYEKMRSKGWL